MIGIECNDSINNAGSQARVDFGSANHQRARGKEPNMLIIDSLLKFKFFSLERCRRTSLFCQAAHIATGLEATSTRHNLDPSYE